MTYGGDEEIVLKEEQSVKAEASWLKKKNVYAQRSSGFQNTDFLRKQNGNMQPHVGQESIIFTRAKKYPWSGSYTRSGKRQSKEIN
jgi:hypothetical protein